MSVILVLLMMLSLGSVLAEGRTKVPAGQLEGGPEVYFIISSAFFKDYTIP